MHLKRPRGLTHRFVQYSGRLYVSSVALAELYVWAFAKIDPTTRLSAIEVMLRDEVNRLDFDDDCAKKFGQLQVELRQRGVTVNPVDLLIASVALVYDLTFVTNNTADFETSPACAWTTGSQPEAARPMIEKWVIDRLDPLKSESLIILGDPQRMIRAVARAVDGWAKENGLTVLFCSGNLVLREMYENLRDDPAAKIILVDRTRDMAKLPLFFPNLEARCKPKARLTIYLGDFLMQKTDPGHALGRSRPDGRGRGPG